VPTLKSWIFYLILSLFLLNGCSSKNDTSYDLRKDRSAPQYMSNPYSGRDQIPNNLVNRNPSSLDTKKSGVIVNSNARLDMAKARKIIGQTKEFKPDTIYINGNRMWVAVYKRGTLMEREKIADEARLHRMLVNAFPHYNIEVRVQEKRR
jgi:hypothetical protein